MQHVCVGITGASWALTLSSSGFLYDISNNKISAEAYCTDVETHRGAQITVSIDTWSCTCQFTTDGREGALIPCVISDEVLYPVLEVGSDRFPVTARIELLKLW